MACRDNQRVIYTSPLKALSNQVPKQSADPSSSFADCQYLASA